MTPKPSRADRLQAVGDLARLLSIGWEFPTRGLAEGILSGAFASDLVACASELAAPPRLRQSCESFSELSSTGPQNVEALLGSLRTDRTILFDIPRHRETSPYESQHVDGAAGKDEVPLFISQSATQVKELLDEAGVSAPPNEPPDHVARECEFLAFCASRERCDPTRSERWADLRLRIGTEHLGRWIPAWAAHVAASAETPFYQALAEVTGTIARTKVLWADARPSVLGRHLPLFTRRHGPKSGGG